MIIDLEERRALLYRRGPDARHGFEALAPDATLDVALGGRRVSLHLGAVFEEAGGA